MTHQTTAVEYGMASTLLCRGRVTGRKASKQASALQAVCPLVFTFPKMCSLRFLFMPVKCLGKLVLSKPEWEVQLCFRCYTCLLGAWPFSEEIWGLRQSSVL